MSQGEMAESGATSVNPGAVAGGVILLVLGGSMLLVDNGFIDTPVRRIMGPAILIALGALMTFGTGGVTPWHRRRVPAGGPCTRPRSRWGRGAGPGAWLIVIGLWQLLVQTHAFGLDSHNSWPLLIILSGVLMLIRGLR
jgi:hypothetical protein